MADGDIGSNDAPDPQNIPWNRSKDLLFLRQVSRGGNLFLRGSTGVDDAVKVLVDHDTRFHGSKKKGTTDRLHLLITKHASGEAASKRKSGAEEEYTEFDQLLTELAELKQEKETPRHKLHKHQKSKKNWQRG